MVASDVMLFNYDEIENIKTNMESVKTELEDVFTNIKEIFNTLNNDSEWTGQTRDEYISF